MHGVENGKVPGFRFKERKRRKKEKGDTLSLRVALFPKGMKLDQT
jgi:hypothetical protein